MAPDTTGRLQAAGLRAMQAHTRVTRKAEAVIEEMEDITSPTHHIKAADLDEDDSMVIAVDKLLADQKRSGTHG